MARNTGVTHCAYNPGVVGQPAETIRTADVAIFTGKMSALEYAVDRGWSYCPWPQGKTLQQAIEAWEKSKLPRVAGSTSTTVKS